MYLDVLWLLNFLVDSLLLWISAIVLKRSFKWKRLMLGGMIGSVSILLMATPMAEVAGHPVAKLALSFLMVFAVFGYKRWRYFITNLLALYFATFLTGGMLLGIHYFISFDMTLESKVFLAGLNGFGDPVSWIFVMFGLPLAAYFTKNRVEDFQDIKIQHDQLVDVLIVINNLELNVTGLIDTGNQLQDPISKSPVMLVSVVGMKELLPAEVILAAEQPDLFLFDQPNMPQEWLERMRFIPAKSVGQAHQLLTAFKADKVIIRSGEKSASLSNTLINFTAIHLSSDDQFACILHPKMALALSLEEVS